jgi:hypothetical protein
VNLPLQNKKAMFRRSEHRSSLFYHPRFVTV